MRMFYFVEAEKITGPIYTPEQAQLNTSNKEFLRNFVSSLLQAAFPNLQPYVLRPCTPSSYANFISVQITQFVDGLFLYNSDAIKFKTNLRDFLVQLKEFAGDNAELYAEDRENELKAAQQAEREQKIKVGGLLKPAEIDQDDEL